MTPAPEVENITKTFPVVRDAVGRVKTKVHALTDVTIHVGVARTLGLVGESGSGKSTLARVAMRLTEPDSGTVRLNGEDISALGGKRLRNARRKMHMVFQDPRSSLDPNWLVGDIVAEPLRRQSEMPRVERDERVAELLTGVGLLAEHASRYPDEFSGGQRQRIAIARALSLNPSLIVCDEAVSALDVSTQAQVLTLLEKLQDQFDLAYLFIAHDLSVVHHISDDIAVMYLGRIVESGPSDEVYHRPRHPYTEALLSAIPRVSASSRRSRILLQGDPPSPIDLPKGCAFAGRCPYAMDMCTRERPELIAWGLVAVACHLHSDGPALAGAPVTEVSQSGPPGARTVHDQTP